MMENSRSQIYKGDTMIDIGDRAGTQRAIVLLNEGETVLAFNEVKREFVTWKVDGDDNVYSGNYFNSLREAVTDFNLRRKK